MVGLLVAGTDTGAGKTLVGAAIAAWWLTHRQTRVAILKAVQCGVGDGEYYREVFGDALSVLTPIYFEAPLAPPLAAGREGKTVDLELLWQTYRRAVAEHDLVLVEGVGGLGCPLGWDYTVADLAHDWRIPVLLVAPIRLGVVSQLVTHAAYARSCKLDLRGILLSEVTALSNQQRTDWADAGLIENLCRVPVLGSLAHLDDLYDREALTTAASHLWLEAALFATRRQ